MLRSTPFLPKLLLIGLVQWVSFGGTSCWAQQIDLGLSESALNETAEGESGAGETVVGKTAAGETLPPIDSPSPDPLFESPPSSAIELAGFCRPGLINCPPSASEFPTVRLTGFFQADAGWFYQDAANIVAVGDIQDGADFRRARLAAVGDVADNVAYIVEFDFGFPGRPSFMDVWMEIQDLPLLQNLRVGHFRNPFGLDGLTSVKDLTFIERSLPFAFLPFRQIGVMAHGVNQEEDFTWALSGFRFPTDPFGAQIGDSGGYGLATRLTGVVLSGEEGLLHIGGAYSLINPSSDVVRYLTPPEVFISDLGAAAFLPSGIPFIVPPFVDTGFIATDTTNLFSGELATTVGSFHAQSELVCAVVDRQGGSTVSFSGVSAQAAYILTGEHRPYNRKQGVLGRIVPNHPFGKNGYGAWELAGRWSYLDLNDADIAGGRLNDLTFGLNWYLNRFTKFQLNYIHAMLDSPVNGESDADIVVARAQLDF